MNDQAFQAHVLRTLAAAQFAAERLDLDSLTAALGVRRSDVRSAISALDRKGLVDALRFRLTLSGYAVGHALRDVDLHPLRESDRASAAA